jgi:hypothetical protein
MRERNMDAAERTCEDTVRNNCEQFVIAGALQILYDTDCPPVRTAVVYNQQTTCGRAQERTSRPWDTRHPSS